ncbi:hypothetical protein OG898_35805 [Streptomyces sp. NBC_00193]|uniref:hypothetical protein n=1 Tax=Streptomyces sp. NBC_00193 TaxID=2975675 RepID=UPI0022510BE8|nr:hypothetical protein [Streptomyces sp. NBC_00193]MCX5301778.1 hypothetical protein [Streptomyces sp. NBC_00193]
MRFLQGAGAAMGAIGFAAAGGASLGILISGLLTQGAGWHWVFYVNVPIGAAAALLAARLIPDDKGPGLGAGVDLLGAALVTTGMMLGVYALATGSEHGWGSARTLGFGLGAILIVSLLGVAAALLAAARVPEDPGYLRDLLPVMLVLGFSAGLAMPAVMTLSMSVGDPRDAGAASGLSGTSGMIGDSLGIAAMAAIAASSAGRALADGESAASAATDGFRLVFAVAAGLVLAAAAVGWFVLPAARPVPPGEGAPSGPPRRAPEAVAS